MSHEQRLTLRALRLLAVIPLFACFGICSPAPSPPPSDTCSSPSSGRVDSVQFAAPAMNPELSGTSAAMDDQPTRMLHDGSPLWLVRGGQGAEMTPLRLVLRGADVPTCIAQDTQIMAGGALAARNRDNLTTYELEPGARITKSFWLPGAYGTDATVSTSVVGLMPSVKVRTADAHSCDSIASCPCVHALTQGSDGLTDAGAHLYAALESCLETCDAGSACSDDGGPCDAQLRACESDPY